MSLLHFLATWTGLRSSLTSSLQTLSKNDTGVTGTLRHNARVFATLWFEGTLCHTRSVVSYNAFLPTLSSSPSSDAHVFHRHRYYNARRTNLHVNATSPPRCRSPLCVIALSVKNWNWVQRLTYVYCFLNLAKYAPPRLTPITIRRQSNNRQTILRSTHMSALRHM